MSDVPTPDYAGAYQDLHRRVSALLSDRRDADLEKVAPATPAWRVRDVVAHMTGVCDDLMNGNMGGVGSDEWTAAHVAKRRDLPFADVLAEWTERTPTVISQMRDLPIDAWGQMCADAATHEQDMRGALGEAGGRDCGAIVIGVDWGFDRIDERLTNEGKGSLTVNLDGTSREVGSGDPSASLRASRFEIARAMTGRRSRTQMEAFEWDGAFDPDELVLATFFHPPERDLVE